LGRLLSRYHIFSKAMSAYQHSLPFSYHPLSLGGMDDALESDIVSTLDELVAEGVIMSGPYETVNYEDEGYPVRNQRGGRTKTVLTIEQLRCSSGSVLRY
jgi:hypothetical protein